MMMRTISFVACMALVHADALTPLNQASCGSCHFLDSKGYRRCNTGPNEDLFPFSPVQPDGKSLGDAEIADDLKTHNVSTAQVVKIKEIETDILKKPINTLFCGEYIANFRDGSKVNLPQRDANGAICARDRTAEALIAADNEAKHFFELAGTSNGYASSFAVSKGQPFPESFDLWGSGGLGDVPMNWCGTYMKYMLCSVAFPQVTGFEVERDQLIDAGRTTGPLYIADGMIRPVELDSCEGMFRVCNRREPSNPEQEDDFVPDEIKGMRGQSYLNKQPRKMTNNEWCELWSEGFGLANAGIAVADDEATVQFESASAATSSVLVTLVLLVVQLLL